VDRNRGVARARAAAHAGDAGTAGEARIGERHEARPGFVAAHHRVDVGPAMERVEQREIALARDAEEAVDAMRDEARDDQFCGGRHVNRTSEIGRFQIKKEQSSSAGVRRIRAQIS